MGIYVLKNMRDVDIDSYNISLKIKTIIKVTRCTDESIRGEHIYIMQPPRRDRQRVQYIFSYF